MKTVLVTGAAGFIGFHMSQRLLDEGYRVAGLDNMNDYYDVSLKEQRLALLKKHDNFMFFHDDISDMGAVQEVFTTQKPALVVHLAAQAGVRYSIDHPDSYISSNIIGTFNILEACRYYPVEHLLYASSSSVYGNQQKTPFATTDPVDTPISLYAATKKSNELMAYTYSHLYGIPATGLRFFTVYGPYGRPDMAYFKFTNKIVCHELIQIYNHGDMKRDFTYIDDIVNGMMAMLEHPPVKDGQGVQHKVYNIGNNHPEDLLYFVETLERLLGIEAKKEFLPMQPGDVYQTYADVSALERDFGYKPSTSLDEGLERFVQWYKEYYRMNGL